MGRWQQASASLLLNHFTRKTSNCLSPSTIFSITNKKLFPRRTPNFLCLLEPLMSAQGGSFLPSRQFSAAPSWVPVYTNEVESGSHDLALNNYEVESKEREEEEENGKIPVKAYFLCTSIDLKLMQAENLTNVVPPTSRSTNYIVLRYYEFPPEIPVFGAKSYVSCSYMVVFQYGSAVLFNIEDHEVENYLSIVRRYASGLLSEMRRDDYAIKEKPFLAEDMEGGPDYIVLKALDTDSIRIIGSVLGQSIALDYFVSQIDGMVEEFAGINRAMEKTGTFTMDRKKLLQLVGKANSNLADVILKVGLFERSEIAWRDAKYAQIYEYLREEYEVTQRFGTLDFKLKFVEHNIYFLQEVIQNRRSDLLEWCIIFLLSVENIISLYEILQASG